MDPRPLGEQRLGEVAAADTEIQAVVQDAGKTPQERRDAIRVIKGRYLSAEVAARALPRTFDVVRDGHAYSLQITSASWDGAKLTVDGSLERDGAPVAISWPVNIVNPPMLVPDPAGSIVRTVEVDRDGTSEQRRYREAPFEAILETILGLAR